MMLWIAVDEHIFGGCAFFLPWIRGCALFISTFCTLNRGYEVTGEKKPKLYLPTGILCTCSAIWWNKEQLRGKVVFENVQEKNRLGWEKIRLHISRLEKSRLHKEALFLLISKKTRLLRRSCSKTWGRVYQHEEVLSLQSVFLQKKIYQIMCWE